MTEHSDIQTKVHGHFEVSYDSGKTWEIEPNLIVTEGLNYLLAAALDAAAQKTTLYIALFGGNVTPLAAWTGANWVANATEFTNYVEAARQVWDKGDAVAGSISNTATPAVFTAGVGGGTVRGAALVEASAKSATTGILIAAARFLTDKVLAETEELRVKYTISATSA